MHFINIVLINNPIILLLTKSKKFSAIQNKIDNKVSPLARARTFRLKIIQTAVTVVTKLKTYYLFINVGVFLPLKCPNPFEKKGNFVCESLNNKLHLPGFK